MSEPFQVDREELLTQLKLIAPAIAKKGVLTHSDYITFRNGRAIAYNGEIAASAKIAFNFEGAVKAATFIALLDKLPDKTITVRKLNETHIVINSPKKKRSIKFPMEEPAGFSFARRDRPKKWRKLHPDFIGAVRRACMCASTDENTCYLGTFVKVTPSKIQGIDNVAQLFQYNFPENDSGMKTDVYFKAIYIKHAGHIEPVKVCETKAWVHFKNTRGVTLSFLRHEITEEYPSFDDTLEIEGIKLMLPKMLSDAAIRGNEVVKTDKDNAFVRIDIPHPKFSDKILLSADNEIQYSESVDKLKYKGKPIAFCIGALMLADIATNFPRCFISEKFLHIKEGNFNYVVSFRSPKKTESSVKKKKKRKEPEDE